MAYYNHHKFGVTALKVYLQTKVTLENDVLAGYDKAIDRTVLGW